MSGAGRTDRTINSIHLRSNDNCQIVKSDFARLTDDVVAWPRLTLKPRGQSPPALPKFRQLNFVYRGATVRRIERHTHLPIATNSLVCVTPVHAVVTVALLLDSTFACIRV